MKEKLLQLRQQLESIAAMSDESAAVVELDQSKVGRLSRMDAMQAQAMAQAAGQRRTVLLKEIDAAMKRIDDGDYGVCQDCDKPINPKRLEIDPTARLCIDCASNAEYSWPGNCGERTHVSRTIDDQDQRHPDGRV